ncbi:MAG TPA: outer membrane beta-barrel family protein [Chitinophagaceae bacterium]|nr:outer membrane beta-barrel family protein [Chitinophagaceae bacterium]
MRKLLAILVIGLAASQFSFAQSGSIKGVISDTLNQKTLQHAVITAIRKGDSVMVAFTRSGPSGEFSLKNLPAGKLIVKVTFPKYADFIDEVTVTDGQQADMGKLSLILKSQLLAEVVVSQKLGAIRIKGDTTVYMADSFKVKEGANVEELLKKMPGIQVNKNGEITAQGEKVQKVLVDGEEFFSDDPAVVTQNLRADAVKTVQVFDKKSDQATFTGIDDGEKSKTINLQLKEDRKKGFFGKAKLAGGIPNSFENEGMLNAFRGKRKVAVFGTMANTGKAGLNWQDNEKFGGGSNLQFNEEEGYFYSMFESDEFNTWGGRYSGEGLPAAWTAGAHFSNKWNADKRNLNINYRYYKQNIEVDGIRKTQTILPNTQYFANEARKTFNQNVRHQLNGFYDFQLDSFSSFKLTVAGTRTIGRSLANYEGLTVNENNRKINESGRTLRSEGEKQQFNSSLLFRHKFQKKGRTLSVNVDQTFNSNETEGFLTFDNLTFDTSGAFLRKDTVDQRKLNSIQTLTLNSRASYTEPLSKTTFLEMNYGYRVSNSEALRNTFNKTFNGNIPKYEARDSLFSNDYEFRINTQIGGLNLRVNKKNFVYSIGGNISYAKFRQTDMTTDSVFSYTYLNLFPRANFRYNLGPQRRISFNYNGNTRQPSLEQIQPIRENTDPLNIQIGNADLKQEFRHNLSLNFSDYKVLTSRNVYLSTNFSFVDNAISSRSTVDSVNRRTTQYVNVDGNYNFNLWMGYWFQIKKLNLHMGFNGGGFIGKFNNFVNDRKNVNDNSNFNIRMDIWHEKENKYSFRIAPGVTRNRSKSSLRPDIVTKYWTSESDIEGTVQLPWKLELNSVATFQFRQKTSVFDRDLNTIRWNAYLGKKFWKNNAGEVRLSVFDILNQNLGFQRNATSNFISENTYNTIRRYWLISFTWNFTKNAATTGNGAGH